MTKYFTPAYFILPFSILLPTLTHADDPTMYHSEIQVGYETKANRSTDFSISAGADTIENQGPRSFIVVQYEGVGVTPGKYGVIRAAEFQVMIAKGLTSGTLDARITITPITASILEEYILVHFGQVRFAYDHYNTFQGYKYFPVQTELFGSTRTEIYAAGLDMRGDINTPVKNMTVGGRLSVDLVALASMSRGKLASEYKILGSAPTVDTGLRAVGFHMGLDAHAIVKLSERINLTFTLLGNAESTGAFSEVATDGRVSISLNDFLRKGGLIGFFMQAGSSGLFNVNAILPDGSLANPEETHYGAGVEWRY